MKKFILLLILLVQYSYTQSDWEKAEGPYGGEARVSYIKGDTLLLGVNRKIYFSTDNGSGWTEVNFNQVVSSFTHSNDTTFFAAAGGITFRSYNLTHWTPLTQGFNQVSTDNRGYLYGIRGSLIFRSPDNGDTWNIHYTLPSSYFPVFLVTPTRMFVTGKGQISRRLLRDNKWTRIRFPEYFNPIKLVTDNKGQIFGVSTYNRLIAYSPDDGLRWTYIDITGQLPNVKPADIAFNGEILIISNSIWDDRTGALLYRSKDSGSTWEPADNGLPAKVPVVYLNSRGNEFYASTFGGGIYRSTDGGLSWQSINQGINELEITKLVMLNDNTLYASTYGRGVLRSTDYGKTWEDFNAGINGMYAGDLVKIQVNTLIASTVDGIFKYTHGEDDMPWQKLRDMVLGMDYLYADKQDRLLLNTGLDLRISNDEGNSWQMYFNVFDAGGIILTDSVTVIVTQMNGKRILRSSNDGQSWDTVLTYDHALYVPVADEIGNIFIPGKYIIKSTDNGITWNTIKTGLVNFYTLTIFSDMRGNYFTSSRFHTYLNAELYYSGDRGNTWSAASGKLLNNEVRDMLFLDTKTFAATNKGLWILDKPLPKSYPGPVIPSEYYVEQNYPNPFNPSTTIRYLLPEHSTVSIKIFDILGNEIAVLVNEEKPAGEYQVQWDASAFSSGVYFYRLTSGEFTSTKKLLLMK